MLSNVKCRMEVKLLLSFVFILLVSSQHSFGQNTDKDIQAKWGILKTALKVRAGLVVDITNDFLMQGKDSKKLVFTTNLIAKAIKLNSDSPIKLDSKMVKAFYAQNDSLENQTFEILVSSEIEKDAATSKKLDAFVAKMDAADKVIKVARKNYNAACKAAKKEDLQYVNLNTKKDVEVKF